MAGRAFFLGLDTLCWLYRVGFLWLLGAAKSWFKGQSLSFMWPNVIVIIILARSNQNYPSVVPTSQDGFWSHRVYDFWFPTLTTILDHVYLSYLGDLGKVT
jgi:hypothetical protein